MFYTGTSNTEIIKYITRQIKTMIGLILRKRQLRATVVDATVPATIAILLHKFYEQPNRAFNILLTVTCIPQSNLNKTDYN